MVDSTNERARQLSTFVLSEKNQLIEQLYTANKLLISKNKEIDNLMTIIESNQDAIEQLENTLNAQNQVNIEQKKKIEKMIKISKEVKNMINTCNGMKPATKEKVLDMFKTCELLINSEDGHQ